MRYPNGDWHEQQFGTPSLATEQDAFRDAHVAELEAALRKIAEGADAGGTFSGTDCADIAREALGLNEVERIPDGVKFPPRGEVAFTRYPVPDGGNWHLIGPSVLLEPGMVVEVQKFTESKPTLVGVGRIVAERTVVHRGIGPVCYVVARVSRAVRE
jgi:hypothetical protein